MAIHSQAVETMCVIWKNIELPHPDRSCKSPVFSLDGVDRYFEVQSSWYVCFDGYGKREKRYDYEYWKFSIKCLDASETLKKYIIIPYAEAEGKYVHLASNIDGTFPRPTLSSKCGLKGDYMTMLFLFIKLSLNMTQNIEEVVNTNLKERETGNGQLQTLYLESLSKDMVQLFDKKRYTDMTLKCGNSSFSVHRNILAARSEVFSAMFDDDITENSSGVVEIMDLDPIILEQFVKYLYSGTVDQMSIDVAIELYQAADKYAVHSLKGLCVSYILDSMTKDNVYKILLFADKTGDMEFQDGVASFAAEDDEFLKTTEWKDFALNNASAAIRVCLRSMNKSQ